MELFGNDVGGFGNRCKTGNFLEINLIEIVEAFIKKALNKKIEAFSKLFLKVQFESYFIYFKTWLQLVSYNTARRFPKAWKK